MATSHRRQLILHPGAELGGYTIEDVLGVGGMAVVYRATQRSLDRQVAIKVLDPRLSDDETFRQRFRREGAHVARLDHPHIVPVHDSGEVDGRLFLAMRFVDGQTLADRMRDPGLSAEEIADILLKIGGALDTAHAAGVLHRDVKPQNILMSGDHPFLADFGVAKGADSSTMTGTGGFLGSVHYASPEQIRGEPMSTATDIYSLSAVAYECFTGQAPFTKPSEVGVIHAHLDEPPPPLPGKLGGGARELSAVVQRGLSKRAGDRQASAGALAAELQVAVRKLSNAERTRRPAFHTAPAPGRAAAVDPTAETGPIRTAPASPSSSRDETVVLSSVAGNTPPSSNTVIDRQSRFVPVEPEVVAVPRGAGAKRAARRFGPPVALLALAVAIPAIAFVGSRGPSERSLTAGSATATVPGRWQVGQVEPDLFGGLAVNGGQEASTKTKAGRIAVSLASLKSPVDSLVPASAAGKVTAIAVGTSMAFAYDTSTSRNVRRLVIVMPQKTGGLAMACRWPAGDTTGNAACDRAAATLSGADGALTPAALSTESKAITAALAPLKDARARTLAIRAPARTTTATKLATAHGTAATALTDIAKANPWDPEVAGAAAGAVAVSTQYRHLATASRKKDKTADRKARTALTAADARLRASLHTLAGRQIKAGI